MGLLGGPRYDYPKNVWSPVGGWWPYPKAWKVNTAIGFGLIIGLNYFVFRYSAEHEWRHREPTKWIPSMLWAKQFTSGELGIDKGYYDHPSQHKKEGEEHH